MVGFSSFGGEASLVIVLAVARKGCQVSFAAMF